MTQNHDSGRWQRLTSLFARGAGTAGPDDSGRHHDLAGDFAAEPGYSVSPEPGDDYYDEAYLREQEIGFLGGDAGSAGANADLAAAYGNQYSGIDEARADWAAAELRRPALSPGILQRVTAYETHKNRAITEPELRWIEHLAAQEAAPDDTAQPTPDLQVHDDLRPRADQDDDQDSDEASW